MFTTFIVQPLFNLLVLIYGLIPSHNFGLALILFTIVIRLLLWPLVKRQLHQTRAMRKLQPEIKRVKKEAKGNRQKESQLLMELYKERGINPCATFPILIVQFIVLIGLYSGLRKLIDDPNTIVTFSYSFVHNLSWIKELSHNIHLFDETLFGVVDLSRAALSNGGIYWPAMIIVLASAAATYFQSKQLLPNDKDQRSLRAILKEAGQGKQADQSEVNAAVGRSTIFLMPVFIFIFTINLPSALGLYWLTGGLVALIQQSLVLRRDEEEMEDIADNKPSKKNTDAIPEAEVVSQPSPSQSSKAKKAKKRKKR
jgi:YidC/Oxa1 family membrane protein insertase